MDILQDHEKCFKTIRYGHLMGLDCLGRRYLEAASANCCRASGSERAAYGPAPERGGKMRVTGKARRFKNRVKFPFSF